MEVTDLQGYSGMVFVYDEDVAGGFYMRNTPTPLSIAWIAADGEVVTITDMEPCEDREGCPTYSPDGPYRYAIETFQGDLDDLGITEDRHRHRRRHLRPAPAPGRALSHPVRRVVDVCRHPRHRYDHPVNSTPCPHRGGPGSAGSTGRFHAHAGL